MSVFEKLRSQAKSSKFQTPISKEAPGPKHQAPNSREAPSSKLEARAAVWSLELGISLVFGAWFLMFRFRDFSGAWGLVLGFSLRGGSKTEMRPRRSRSHFPTSHTPGGSHVKRRLQIADQHAHVRISFVRVALKTLEDHFFQRCRNVRVQLARREEV